MFFRPPEVTEVRSDRSGQVKRKMVRKGVSRGTAGAALRVDFPEKEKSAWENFSSSLGLLLPRVVVSCGAFSAT